MRLSFRSWRGDPRPNDLRVVTNDFEITQLLIDASQCGVIHTGGTCAGRTALRESAARTLRHPAIDTAFISASGWDSRGYSP